MAVEFNLKVGTTSSNVATLPAPTSYEIEYEDQSDPEAGRVESGKMYKKRKGTIRKATFSWRNLNENECQQVFTAFQSEYIFAQILDPFKKQNVIEEFYVGNRKAKYRSENNGYWESIDLSIVGRDFAQL